MQVVTPGQGNYLMPIVWYFAPPDAKRLDCVNAFTSGIWDREKVALPPRLGEQPPYQFPFSKGENVWGYKGQCRIGTDAQFLNGLTQDEATGLPPDQKTIPVCCRGKLYPPVPPFPQPGSCSACNTGAVGARWLQMPVVGSIRPGDEALYAVTVVPYVGACVYQSAVFETATFGPVYFEYQLGLLFCQWNLREAASGAFVFSAHGPRSCFGDTTATIDSTPITPYPWVIGTPFPIFAEEPVPIGPIVLAGDVLGTGYPLIPTALVSIVAPGSVGDSTHIPVFTVDAKGRVTALSQVAISTPSGVTIGDPVSGGIPNAVLFVDISGNLANAGAFQFDGTNVAINGPGLVVTNALSRPVVFAMPGFSATFIDGIAAVTFRDGTHTVMICDGVNNISYTPLTPGNWAGFAPTDVWAALDRLAQWMNSNFPALPLP